MIRDLLEAAFYYSLSDWMPDRSLSTKNQCKKFRDRQWKGYDQKIIAIRRKRNKNAKKARKIQRRR